MNQQTSFVSPGYDYSADLSAIERRKALAAAMQQQSMQGIEAQPTPPGGFTVPISPWQGAAKLAQAMAAARQGSKAEEQQRTLAAKAQADLADVLRRGSQAAAGSPGSPMPSAELGGGPAQPAQAPNPMGAASTYMQHPMTAPLGMQMAQKEMEQQATQRALAEYMKNYGAAQQPAGVAEGSAQAVGAPWAAQPQQQPSQGGIGGVNPQVMGLLTSNNPGLNKLGQAIQTASLTRGNVHYDQQGRAFTVNAGGQPTYLQGVGQPPMTEQQRRQLALDQAKYSWETGLRAPGDSQAPRTGIPPQDATAAALSPQPAPSPRPMPGIAPKAQSAINVEAGKEFISEMRVNYSKLRDVPATLENIERGKQLATTQAQQFMGPFGESKLALTKFFRSNVPGMGNLKTEGVTSAEQLQSTLFNQVMDNLKKMDASPSQYQQQVMQEAFGTLRTDPKSVPKIMDVFADILRNRVSIHNDTVKSAEGRGTVFPHDVSIKLKDKVPSFTNAAEAAQAGLKPGTKIIVNGVPGVWQ